MGGESHWEGKPLIHRLRYREGDFFTPQMCNSFNPNITQIVVKMQYYGSKKPRIPSAHFLLQEVLQQSAVCSTITYTNVCPQNTLQKDSFPLCLTPFEVYVQIKCGYWMYVFLWENANNKIGCWLSTDALPLQRLSSVQFSIRKKEKSLLLTLLD